MWPTNQIELFLIRLVSKLIRFETGRLFPFPTVTTTDNQKLWFRGDLLSVVQEIRSHYLTPIWIISLYASWTYWWVLLILGYALFLSELLLNHAFKELIQGDNLITDLRIKTI